MSWPPEPCPVSLAIRARAFAGTCLDQVEGVSKPRATDQAALAQREWRPSLTSMCSTCTRHALRDHHRLTELAVSPTQRDQHRHLALPRRDGEWPAIGGRVPRRPGGSRRRVCGPSALRRCFVPGRADQVPARPARQRGRSQPAPSASAEPGGPSAIRSSMAPNLSESVTAYISHKPMAPRNHAWLDDRCDSSLRMTTQNASGVTCLDESSAEGAVEAGPTVVRSRA
jgi:hypothetical protein